MTGTEKVLKEIAEERIRQIEDEGYDPQHDDEHSDYSLALAAAHYCAPDCKPVFLRRDGADGQCIHHSPWPWHKDHDKRKKHDYRRRLVIAGAFIAAEIERIDREAERWERNAQAAKAGSQDSSQ
jgi:hypothetical protein